MRKTVFKKFLNIINHKELWINIFFNIEKYKDLQQYPIIICGCPRSGTTLVMSILDSHPDIHVIPFESMVFQKIDGRFSHYNWLNIIILKGYFLLLLFSNKIKPSSIRWAEKTPLNILNVNQINSLFNGKVKFINVIRDGRAVVSSTHLKLGNFVTHELWKECVKRSIKYKDLPNFLSIKYEELNNNPDVVLKQISEFLDLSISFKTDKIFSNSSINGIMKKPMDQSVDLSPIASGFNRDRITAWKKMPKSKNLISFLADKEATELNARLGYK